MTSQSDVAARELQRLATNYARKRGISYAEAYAKAADEFPGVAAIAADGGAAEAAAGPVAESDAIEDALDRAAEERAERTGETFLKAYDAVLMSPDGREAYAAICDLREEASRRAARR